MTSRLSHTILGCSLLAVTACGVPVGRALPSHRAGAPVWRTTGISEQGDRLRVTVQTSTPEQATLVALRIINQRRAQNWQVIEVDVHGADGERAALVSSTSPHPAATLRDTYANLRDVGADQ